MAPLLRARCDEDLSIVDQWRTTHSPIKILAAVNFKNVGPPDEFSRSEFQLDQFAGCPQRVNELFMNRWSSTRSITS